MTGEDQASIKNSSGHGDSPVDRAFYVLQTVVAANEPIGVREIGRRTGLPRSTASRLVLNLERLRMVDRNPAGEISPGGALATLQTTGSTTPLLRDQIQPILVELVQQFEENAALAVDDGDALLYVSNVESENAVSVHDVTGERHQFHLVAPGIITMTNWSPTKLARYLKAPLESANEHSVIKAKTILDRIKQAELDGYVWTNQELDVGINGLAVPVVVEGTFAGSVSVYGPSYRFSPQKRPNLGTQLRSIVDQRLGSRVR